jgi:hypothetical protein
LVGLYVPLTNGMEKLLGIVPVAESSKVRLRLLTGERKPVSDISTMFPPGPSSRMSKSAGDSCARPVSVTLTSLIRPLMPVTVMFDG